MQSAATFDPKAPPAVPWAGSQDAGYLSQFTADLAALGFTGNPKLRICRVGEGATAIVTRGRYGRESWHPELPLIFLDYDLALAWAVEVLNNDSVQEAK